MFILWEPSSTKKKGRLATAPSPRVAGAQYTGLPAASLMFFQEDWIIFTTESGIGT